MQRQWRWWSGGKRGGERVWQKEWQKRWLGGWVNMVVWWCSGGLHTQHVWGPYNVSQTTMGPSDTIGSMSLEGHWVHSKSLAAFLWSNTGPIHSTYTLIIAHGTFASGLYGLLGMIFFLILVQTLIIYSMRFFTSSALSLSTNLSIAPIKFSSLLDKSQIALSIWWSCCIWSRRKPEALNPGAIPSSCC